MFGKLPISFIQDSIMKGGNPETSTTKASSSSRLPKDPHVTHIHTYTYIYIYIDIYRYIDIYI